MIDRQFAVTLYPPCALTRHDLRLATNRELARGYLDCGCAVDGKAAARMLNARRLARPAQKDAS